MNNKTYLPKFLRAKEQHVIDKKSHLKRNELFTEMLVVELKLCNQGTFSLKRFAIAIW